jgi:hypothetical protein
VSSDDQNAKSSVAEAIAGLRAHVNSALSAGMSPEDVSFALAYVAVDLGLYTATKSAQALHVVFQAVVAAAHAHEQASTAAAAREPTDEQSVAERPSGATLQ